MRKPNVEDEARIFAVGVALIRGTRWTPEFFRLAEVRRTLERNLNPSRRDRDLLLSIVADIARDADPRRRFFVAKRRGARERDYRFYVALHVLLLGDSNSKAIRAQVCDAWNLKDRTVREILAEMRKDAALVIAGGRGDRLLSIVEFERERHVAALADISK